MTVNKNSSASASGAATTVPATQLTNFTGHMQRSKFNQPSTWKMTLLNIVNVGLLLFVLAMWIKANTGDNNKGVPPSVASIFGVSIACIAVFMMLVVFPVFFKWENVLRPDYDLSSHIQFGMSGR